MSKRQMIKSLVKWTAIVSVSMFAGDVMLEMDYEYKRQETSNKIESIRQIHEEVKDAIYGSKEEYDVMKEEIKSAVYDFNEYYDLYVSYADVPELQSMYAETLMYSAGTISGYADYIDTIFDGIDIQIEYIDTSMDNIEKLQDMLK